MRILVVEDEVIVAQLVTAALTEAGHAIVGPAGTACAALKDLSGERPDLALIDLVLPGGTSGADLARCMRHLYGVPSIFMSATPQECRRNAAFSGTLGCLSKPFTDYELTTAVEIAQAIIAGQPAMQARPMSLELYC